MLKMAIRADIFWFIVIFTAEAKVDSIDSQRNSDEPQSSYAPGPRTPFLLFFTC